MARWARNTVVKFVGATLTVRDDANVLRHAGRVFDEMYFRGRDLSPVFAQQRQRFQAASEMMFRTQGWVTPWPPLTPAYAAWKAKAFPGMPIMRRSDRLYSSLVGETPDSVWRVTPHSIQFGTRVPYWPDHQFGNPGTNLPARPTIVLDYWNLSFIGDDVVEWVIAADRAAAALAHGGGGFGGRVKGMIKRMLGPAEKYIEFVRTR